MDVQLQELIDKIKKAGVDSADKKAAQIEAEAEKKAEEIIADAEKRAEDILKKANFVKKPDKWVIKWNYKDKEGYLVKEEVNIYFDDKTRLWYYGNDVDLTRRYKVREFGIWFEGHKEKITDYGRYVERSKPVPGQRYRYTKEMIRIEKVDQTQYDLDCYLNFSTYLTQKHIDEWKRRH